MSDITKIDPNFKASAIPHDDIVWYDALDPCFSLHGLYKTRETGHYNRLPLEWAQDPNVSEGLRHLMFHTAGGRIRFATDSPYIAIAMELPSLELMSHMPLTGSSGADVYFAPRGCREELYRGTIFPATQYEGGKPAFSGCVSNPRGRYPSEVTVSLPLYNAVSRVFIGLQKDAFIEAPRTYTLEKPILFYGSSITQGGCASRPGNNYMNHVCRWLDADFINFGFSGNAKGEAFMADFIASHDLTAFVMDYDHNAPDAAHLEKTHYAFYRRIRDARPDLPILLITAPFPFQNTYSQNHTLDYPYDASANRFRTFQRRHDVILDTYMRGRSAGDLNLMFLDGASLYADRDQDACTVDGAHPNDLGFYRFAQAVYPYLRKLLEV